jgi:hypothetical protein
MVQVGFPRGLLARIGAAASAAELTRTEWIRRACMAVLDRSVALGDTGTQTESGTVAYMMPTGGSPMSRGRYGGYYPCSDSDADIVADLRRRVPGGWVVLRRCNHHVFARIDPPEYRARQRELDFPYPPRGHVEIAPGATP